MISLFRTWLPQTGKLGCYSMAWVCTECDHRELIMDILKYGADCEVLEPASLVNKVLAQMEQMRRNYSGKMRG